MSVLRDCGCCAADYEQRMKELRAEVGGKGHSATCAYCSVILYMCVYSCIILHVCTHS